MKNLASPLSEEAAADREDLETLSLVVSRSGNAILILNEEGEIEWSNKAFEKLSGYPANEILGSKLESLVFGPSTETITRNRFAQAIRNGHEFNEDVLQYRKDGTTLWVESKLIPVPDDSGETSRWISLQTDITRRRQTQEALLAAKKSAESSSRAKSEFLANMSHEIRTPMNAILGMTDLALATHLTREQRDYLNTVRTSADSLLGILNDVLDISKIEAGKMELESLEFSLGDVVRETLRALAIRAHEKGLELAVHMPVDLPSYFTGDPIRLRQVLFNLVGNAIKFTHQGEIVVSVEQQWSTASHVSLHFTVRDTGIGIPKDRLERIFESFSQVDSSMARRFGGSGLGLTITAQLLALMNGKIWVQSEEGEGTSFHFTLQLELANEQDMPQPATRDQLLGMRVLVVDDNSTNRWILEELLRNWGMHPVCVDSAVSAVDELQKEPTQNFDVILLDAMMPGMDGFQLAEKLQKDKKFRASTVMMLSSADRPFSATKCQQLGIESYLVKPVTASTLLEALLETLGHERKAEKELGEPVVQKSVVPKRVLVVDDYEPNRKIACEVLTRRGHFCEEVSDGETAIQRVMEESYDIVLMDVQMPSMDGLMATKKIRSQEDPNARTRIVALTAHALDGDREKCLRAGMDDYLSKPLHAETLIAMVEQDQSASVRTDTAAATENDKCSEPRFSISSALQRMGNEQDLLLEHIKYTISDIPVLISSMRQSAEVENYRELEVAAHRMKSLVSSYEFTAAFQLAQRIEGSARDQEHEDYSTWLDSLESQLTSFVEELSQTLQTAENSFSEA